MIKEGNYYFDFNFIIVEILFIFLKIRSKNFEVHKMLGYYNFEYEQQFNSNNDRISIWYIW